MSRGAPSKLAEALWPQLASEAREAQLGCWPAGEPAVGEPAALLAHEPTILLHSAMAASAPFKAAWMRIMVALLLKWIGASAKNDWHHLRYTVLLAS